jgi:hypothetical protein
MKKMRAGDMMKRITTAVLSLGMLFLLPLNVAYAENAEVLPKNVTRLRLNSKFYFPVDEQYNDSGDTEPIATDYNTNMNSSVFPDLSLIEQAFGMPAGSGSVGNSVVSIEYEFNLFDFYIERGITDRLSVGVKVPYWNVKNDVTAELDSSSATVGKNPFIPGGVAPVYVPGTTVPFPGTERFTTDDVQNMLVQEYGYKRIGSWSGSGLSDIEVGARYQYLKTEKWRLAFTGGVRLPTGETDDPDDLMDYALGSGAWGLLFYFNNDYTGIKNTILNLTLKYDLILPDKEEVRVPEDVNQPIVPIENKEEVDRDIGDIIEINASARYQFLKGSSVYLEYLYAHKFKDSVSGNKGLAYDQLEAESDRIEHVFKIGLGYSTIPLYQEKKFPVPLTVDILYRNRFAGKNALKSDYIGIGLAVFF